MTLPMHQLIYVQSMDVIQLVSGFYGKGKVKTAKLLFKEKTFQQALGEISMEPAASECYFENLRSMSVICMVT